MKCITRLRSSFPCHFFAPSFGVYADPPLCHSADRLPYARSVRYKDHIVTETITHPFYTSPIIDNASFTSILPQLASPRKTGENCGFARPRATCGHRPRSFRRAATVPDVQIGSKGLNCYRDEWGWAAPRISILQRNRAEGNGESDAMDAKREGLETTQTCGCQGCRASASNRESTAAREKGESGGPLNIADGQTGKHGEPRGSAENRATWHSRHALTNSSWTIGGVFICLQRRATGGKWTDVPHSRSKVQAARLSGSVDKHGRDGERGGFARSRDACPPTIQTLTCPASPHIKCPIHAMNLNIAVEVGKGSRSGRALSTNKHCSGSARIESANTRSRISGQNAGCRDPTSKDGEVRTANRQREGGHVYAMLPVRSIAGR